MPQPDRARERRDEFIRERAPQKAPVDPSVPLGHDAATPVPDKLPGGRKKKE
ncbi:MAG: hypothetical protein ABIV63_18220 [Caldimonas sp.]